MKEKKLTLKQELFCKEYMVDLNATQAAIRAGYSRKTANNQVGQLLVNIGIQEKIQELLKEREKQIDRSILESEVIAHSDIADYVEFENGQIRLKNFSEIPKELRGAISCIEQTEEGIKKLKLHPKDTQLTNQLKMKGFLTEKLQAKVEMEIKKPFDLSKLSNEEYKEFKNLAKKCITGRDS